jgi:hypothetical protein
MSGGFKVCAERCDQCLFSKQAIVDNARRRQVLADCARRDTHFVCHKHGVGDDEELHGEDVCCRGFYDRDPMATNLMRIAARLGVVEFVEEPVRGTRHG